MKKIIQGSAIAVLLLLSSCKQTDELNDKFEQLSFTNPVLECSAAENTLETALNFDRWNVISYKVIENGDTVQVENQLKYDGMIKYYDNNIKGDWFTINKDGNKIIIHLTKNQTGQKRAINIFCEGIMLFGAELKVTQD
ncbi:MAG: hypothetical protein ACRC9Q_05900 [Bacteroidales bacterium]